MCVCIVRIEFEGALEFLLCLGPVPVIFESLGQRKMSLWEGRIQVYCLAGRLFGLRQSLLRRMNSPARVSQRDVGVGQSRVRYGVGWVPFDRVFKVLNRR